MALSAFAGTKTHGLPRFARYFSPCICAPKLGVITTFSDSGYFYSRRDEISNSLGKQIQLIFALVFSVTVAIFVLIWARTDSPIYRPLIQDMRLVDSVEIVDVLDQEDIKYYSDVKNHMLYVDRGKSDLARVALAKRGFVIEYPKITKHSDLNEAYDEFIKQQKEKEVNGKVWEHPAFLQLVKLVVGGLVIIVLILAVVRPMLRQLLLGDKDE